MGKRGVTSADYHHLLVWRAASTQEKKNRQASCLSAVVFVVCLIAAFLAKKQVT